MTSGVTKAVVPVAGLGTRFLPATKATPKEMLPVVDKPAIQYVVEEAVRAGLDDVLLVTGRSKTPLEDHFDRHYELEDRLEGDEGKRNLLDQVRGVTELATVHYVRQGEARGLGHAVLCAAQHVGSQPFAVLLGDDLIDERDVLLTRMIEVQQRLGGCVVALIEVAPDQIGLYGCAAVEDTDEVDVVRITGLVEKPLPGHAPSNLAIIGRYVLAPEIFDVLRQTPPGRGGEIQVTDAIDALTDRNDAGGPVHGVVFRGRRYDTGDKADYLKAIVQLACDREDLGPAFRDWLGEFVAWRLPLGDPSEPLSYEQVAMTEPLKSVEAHLADIMAAVSPLGGLELTLADAHGCVLVEDVHSTFPLPPFDNSAMDGYAVRAEDVAAASATAPVVLPVVGDVAAGSTSPYTVQPGLCVRIMTGAPMPPGANAVVPLEDTDGGIAQVAIGTPTAPGRCVRVAGEDAVTGTQVLSAGTHLGATQLGLLAAVGRDRVVVRPRPRVVVLSTGSELVEPGQQLSRGQIPDANSSLLTAAALEAGAIAYRVGIVPDEPGVLADTLEDQLIRADVIVTSGGVSVGAYDVVKEVLSRVGTVHFDKVAMQPGMPQGFGLIGPDQIPFFGLPGNPVSAYVSFEVFVRPALRRMLGVEPIMRPIVRARVTEALRSPPGRRSYLRAWLSVEQGAYTVRPVGGAGSHLIASLAASNALIVVPETSTEVDSGAAVSVLMLERRQQ